MNCPLWTGSKSHMPYSIQFINNCKFILQPLLGPAFLLFFLSPTMTAFQSRVSTDTVVWTIQLRLKKLVKARSLRKHNAKVASNFQSINFPEPWAFHKHKTTFKLQVLRKWKTNCHRSYCNNFLISDTLIFFISLTTIVLSLNSSITIWRKTPHQNSKNRKDQHFILKWSLWAN